MSEDDKAGRVHNLTNDHDDVHGAPAYLAHWLGEANTEAVMVVVFSKNQLRHASFGKISREETTYLAAVLNHAAVCDHDADEG